MYKKLLIKTVTGTNIIPSYVHYSSEGVCIGKKAIQKFATDPQNVLFDAKRLLAQRANSDSIRDFLDTWSFRVVDYPDEPTGKAHFVSDHVEDPIPPENVSTEILKPLLNEVCRQCRVQKGDLEVVVTVPAYFNINQKRATRTAAENAGIVVRQILSEPVAAALAYQNEMKGDNRLKEGDCIFIFDLGGGTFDATIMRIHNGIYRIIALGGDAHLGGRDFDQVIADIMEGRIRQQLGNNVIDELRLQPRYRYRLTQRAHETKEAFSEAEENDLPLEEICPGAENEELTREEFEEGARHLRNRIHEHCNEALAIAENRANIALNNINYVLVVGGASKMNMVQGILTESFPSENHTIIPRHNTFVSQGATLYATRFLEGIEDLQIEEMHI